MIHIKYVGCSPVPLPLKSAPLPFPLSFQLYYNACALHEFTHNERKNTRYYSRDNLSGEFISFQEPQLSSLMRLVCFHPDWFLSEYRFKLSLHRI